MNSETEDVGQSSELTCDTCGRSSSQVSRVVVDAEYNRANARPLYNCPECYEKKLKDRVSPSPSG